MELERKRIACQGKRQAGLFMVLLIFHAQKATLNATLRFDGSLGASSVIL